MPRICYTPRKFSAASLDIIDRADAICTQYAAQGYTLTLRQVFYQFVSRGWIANKQSEYKRLGSVLNDARLAGLLDWDHMEDRTRNLRSVSHWDSPADVIAAAARSYRIDKWADQPYYVEVWIEKDALVGVIERVCRELDVPFFSCRGYTSQSELWAAGMRLAGRVNEGKRVKIIHLGDHDPSGIDMTRDIGDRLDLFVREHADAWHVEVDRLALNMPQIEQYDPPPNPAKLTDSRAGGYIAEHGYESWELDALEPVVIGGLITSAVDAVIDWDLWEASVDREEQEREDLATAASRWGSAA